MKGKTARYILAALAGTSVLLGCTREAEPLAPVILTAVLEQADTRTAYDGTQGKLTWTEGDQVAVHVGNSYQTAEVTPSDGHLAVSETASAYRNYYAVYPASAADAANYGNSTLKVNLPASYDISDIVSGASAIRTADFSPCPMVAVNDTDDSMLRFYHVGGLLRITLTGVKAATKTVTVTFDKDVTGSYEVHDPASRAPYIETAGTSSGNVVTYTVASSSVGSYTVPVVLNVPVPCGTYASVTVETLDASGTSLASKTYDSEPLVFLRHHGKKLAFSEMTLDFAFGSLAAVTSDYTGGAVSLSDSFVSYKTSDGGATKTAVPFTLEYSEDDGTTWTTTPPSWLTPDGGIDYDGSASGQILGVTVAPQVNSAPDPHHDALVANGSYSTAFDLSTKNVATGGTVTRSTANCYVVDRPGNYKFPLVYGNGVDWTKNTSTGINESAYRAKTISDPFGEDPPEYLPDDGEPDRMLLGRFKDHLDNNLMSPYIATQQPGKAMSAVLVWEDVRGLVTVDSSISGSGENAYVTFCVPEATITQGNALVALLVDDNGDGTPETIAWSWHIWVTEEDLADLKEGSNGNFFSPVNLGWCDGKTEAYTARSCLVRAVQESSGRFSDPVSVTESDGSAIYGGNNTYYQWGRKDPIQASNGRAYPDTFDKPYYPSKLFYAPISVSEVRVSIGEAIRNPYKNYAAGSEWCSGRYGNFWSSTLYECEVWDYENAKTKTIYDPSPVGFRVPSLDAFRNITDENTECVTVDGDKGRAYTPSGLFFPYAGGRNFSTYVGEARHVGSLGVYWSSVPQGYKLGYAFQFTEERIDPNFMYSPHSSSSGYSVRPVRDN